MLSDYKPSSRPPCITFKPIKCLVITLNASQENHTNGDTQFKKHTYNKVQIEPQMQFETMEWS